MLIHAIIFELKSPDLAKIEGILATMRQTIPSMYEVSFGAHVHNPFEGYNDRSNGYNYALVSKHENVQALKKYAEHAEHIVLVLYLRSIMGKAPTCVDFEVPTPEGLSFTNSKI